MIKNEKTNRTRLTQFIEDVPPIIAQVMTSKEILEFQKQTPIHVRITNSVRQLSYGVLTMSIKFWLDDGRREELHLIFVRPKDRDTILYGILNGSGSGFEPLYFSERSDSILFMQTYLPSIVHSTILKLVHHKPNPRLRPDLGVTFSTLLQNS